jgi:hypothetical protein
MSYKFSMNSLSFLYVLLYSTPISVLELDVASSTIDSTNPQKSILRHPSIIKF